VLALLLMGGVLLKGIQRQLVFESLRNVLANSRSEC
jgi:hypothetical protein